MLTPDQILEKVSSGFSLKSVDLKGKSRVQNICDARFFFCEIMHELTGSSDELIGKHINRHRLTVLHGKKRAQDLISTYPYMESLYKKIKYEITMEYTM